LLLAVCLVAATLVTAAGAADRMWIGFHDDPTFRYDGGRDDAIDRARTVNNATIVRTQVEWSAIAPSRPANAADPFDPAYRFDDLDELVRSSQTRGMEVLITLWGTPGWANGNQKRQVLPTRLTDFTSFARAVAARYSGRFAGYPSVRFFSIWNESNLATFLVPQFDARGQIVSPRNYAKLAAAGYAGIKAGNPRAQVAVGETSSNGRNVRRPGQTDTVAPATFMQLVAKANKRLKFDAWGHHPYPSPVNQAPTQKVRWPNVTLTSMARFGTELDKAFGRKQIPVWITEYGNETKPGEPKGVTETQQRLYAPQAIAIAKKDPRISMFIWFVMQDSAGSTWQSGLYRSSGAAKPAQASFAAAARSLDPRNGRLSIKGGTRNPKLTVFLREYCATNPIGSTVGYTVRSFLAGKLVQVSQGASALGTDCTVALRPSGLTVAKRKTYTVTVEANTATSSAIGRTITIVGS